MVVLFRYASSLRNDYSYYRFFLLHFMAIAFPETQSDRRRFRWIFFARKLADSNRLFSLERTKMAVLSRVKQGHQWRHSRMQMSYTGSLAICINSVKKNPVRPWPFTTTENVLWSLFFFVHVIFSDRFFLFFFFWLEEPFFFRYRSRLRVSGGTHHAGVGGFPFRPAAVAHSRDDRLRSFFLLLLLLLLLLFVAFLD